MKRKIYILLTILVLVFSNVSIANGASASAFLGYSGSVVVGNSVTLTVSISGTQLLAGTCSITVDDGSVLSYAGYSTSTGTVTENNPTFLWESSDMSLGDSKAVFYVKFNAKKVGSTKVYLNTSDFIDSSGRVSPGSDYVTITVTDPPKSGNNSLESISPSIGTLVPEFSSDITEYSITVENSISEIVFGYTPSSSEATAKISGSNEIAVGNNERTITVTAANGNTKSYKINIIRADEAGNLPDGTNYYEIQRFANLGLTIKNKTYILLEDFNGYKIPDGFILDSLEYNGYSIPVLKANKTDICMAFAIPYGEESDKTNDEISNNETSNDNLSSNEDASLKEFSNGTWVFYDSKDEKFTKNYTLKGKEIINYSHYLLYGDEEEPEEQQPSILDDTVLMYLIMGTLAVLFIVIICLQISILTGRNKVKKIKKNKKSKEEVSSEKEIEIKKIEVVDSNENNVTNVEENKD